MSDLELLPHMYAPLQLMFAEHCVELELKAQNRARQKKRKASSPALPSSGSIRHFSTVHNETADNSLAIDHNTDTDNQNMNTDDVTTVNAKINHITDKSIPTEINNDSQISQCKDSNERDSILTDKVIATDPNENHREIILDSNCVS